MVITDLGCYDFRQGEMTLTSLHPGSTVAQIRDNLGWDVQVDRNLKTTEPPSLAEIRQIREQLDPTHLYI